MVVSFVGGVVLARINALAFFSLAQLFGGVQRGFHASGNFTCGESVVNICWYRGLSSKVE